MLICIPLLLIWQKETLNPWFKKGILLAIPIIYAASLSSWSRGALLTMAALTLMLIWNIREQLATVGAFVDVYLIKPVPALGKPEPIFTEN